MASLTVSKTPTLADLLADVPPGNWVAISRDELSLLATDPDLGVAIQRAHETGEAEPLCWFVPDESEGLFVF